MPLRRRRGPACRSVSAYLAELNKSVSPAKVDSGTVYRLRVSGGTAANAANLCGKLRVAGENCVVVR